MNQSKESLDTFVAAWKQTIAQLLMDRSCDWNDGFNRHRWCWCLLYDKCWSYGGGKRQVATPSVALEALITGGHETCLLGWPWELQNSDGLTPHAMAPAQVVAPIRTTIPPAAPKAEPWTPPVPGRHRFCGLVGSIKQLTRSGEFTPKMHALGHKLGWSAMQTWHRTWKVWVKKRCLCVLGVQKSRNLWP